MEQQLINQVGEEDFSLQKECDKTIILLLENLRKSNQVVIATDKTTRSKLFRSRTIKMGLMTSKKIRKRNRQKETGRNIRSSKGNENTPRRNYFRKKNICSYQKHWNPKVFQLQNLY